MKNEAIRKYAKQNKIALWQIAHELGISEPTMTRKLRFEMDTDEKSRIITLIGKLAGDQK